MLATCVKPAGVNKPVNKAVNASVNGLVNTTNKEEQKRTTEDTENAEKM